MKRTYRGSCHCRVVTFEADIDLDKGTRKCNCTFCWKQRMWKAEPIAASDFRLLTGENMLGDYSKSGEWGEGHHRFCMQCGIATHTHGKINVLGKDPFVVVQIAALEDLAVDDLMAAPLTIADGLHDDWSHPPRERRHL